MAWGGKGSCELGTCSCISRKGGSAGKGQRGEREVTQPPQPVGWEAKSRGAPSWEPCRVYSGCSRGLQRRPGTSWEGAQGSGWWQGAWERGKCFCAPEQSKRQVSLLRWLTLPLPLTGSAISEHLQERCAGTRLLLPFGSAASAVGGPRAGTSPARQGGNVGRCSRWAVGGIHTLL